jgi:hypothetical protein
MGYRVDRRVDLVLVDMDGAEVEVDIGVPLATLREWDLTTTIEDEWSTFLAAALPAWNLEDALGPIPADESALERLPLPVTRAIMRGWREAAVNPPAPLPPPSSDGTP